MSKGESEAQERVCVSERESEKEKEKGRGNSKAARREDVSVCDKGITKEPAVYV